MSAPELMEIAILFGFIGAIWSAVVAGNKNRNPIGYLVLGFLIPLVGVLVAYGAAPLPPAEGNARS